MTLSKIASLKDTFLTTFNPSAGSASGSSAYIAPAEPGFPVECGFLPQVTVNSTMTLAVNVVNWTSSTSSVLTEIVSSTLGTFAAAMLVPGNVCSTVPPSPVFMQAGDTLRFTTSGGDGVTKGATIYTIFRRGT